MRRAWWHLAWWSQRTSLVRPTFPATFHAIARARVEVEIHPTQTFTESVSAPLRDSNRMASRDATAEDVAVELQPFIRLYKSGRVERLIGNDTVPASLDDGTSTGGVASKDVTVDPATNLSVRLYLPTADGAAGEKLPIVVYFHGGGFMVESAGSAKYHRYLNAFVARAGAIAVSVDYRRVPEHRLPAAYDDSWAALTWAVGAACGGTGSEPEPWLAEHGDPFRVFLAGDSAGANIAHNVAMRAAAAAAAEGLPAIRIRGVLLMHPYFWDASDAMGPELEERIRREWQLMTGRPDARVDDPWLSPTSARAPPLALLPTQRVLVAVAGEDFLAPKGRAYYTALLDSGWPGDAELVDTPGEQHVFYLDQPGRVVAEKLMDRVVAFISRAGWYT
ncbi:probable carboxylesterase 12 isoform X2 [Miscanthus floridulus]|uniref:probable carboxylesterase 12 isoform X2 n=1 Tax=Miscanthus floridulus TaxID=154761 RepID=UPI00345A6063